MVSLKPSIGIRLRPARTFAERLDASGGLRLMYSRCDIHRLEGQRLMEFFMERDEIACVLLFAVKIVCFFGLKALDEYQFVRIVGAGEKVVCDTACLISGQRLNRRCNADDLVASPGLQLNGNQKFVHGIF